MNSIAWAIVFLSICILDGVYVTKLGPDYRGGEVAFILACLALVCCLACTIRDGRRR